MKNCVMIHGGPLSEAQARVGNLNKLHWFPWVEDRLKENNISTFAPEMPHSSNPVYDVWKDIIDQTKINSESVLVGHSRGCAFLLRYLSETKKAINKLILVSPNLRTQSVNEVVKEFYRFEVDKDIQKRVKEIILFCSNNEDEDQKWAREVLIKNFNCQVIELPDHGHYISQDMSSDEFPELVEIIRGEASVY